MTFTFVTFEYPLTKLLSPKDPPFCRNKNIDSFGLSSSKYSIEGGRSDLKENLPFPIAHPHLKSINDFIFYLLTLQYPLSKNR